MITWRHRVNGLLRVEPQQAETDMLKQSIHDGAVYAGHTTAPSRRALTAMAQPRQLPQGSW